MRRTIALAAAALATAVNAQTAGTDTTRPGVPGGPVPPTVANPTGGSPVPSVPLGSALEPGPATASPHSGGARLVSDPNTIRHVQSQLMSAGHDPGPIDGKLSVATSRAVRNFQQAHGLQVTGELDKRTLAALGIQDTAGIGAQGPGTSTSQQPTPEYRQASPGSRNGASTTGGGSTTGTAPSNVPSPSTSGATGSNMSGTTDTNSATRR